VLFRSAPARKPSYMRDQTNEGGAPNAIIHIDNLDEDAIQQWWDIFKKSHKWDTLSQNCSTTVAQALMVGGATPALALDGIPMVPVVWSPADVERFSRANSR
jgi:hypothetical protein